MATSIIDPAEYASLPTRRKKELWAAHPVRGDVTIELDGVEPFVMYSDNDDTVVKELYWTRFRGWERTSLAIWSAITRGAPAGLVLDVGAYTGIYALIAARSNPAHRVRAVDIQPRCLARVELNRDRNGLANIVTIHAAAIESTGTVPYFYYEETDVLSSIAGVVPNRQNDRTAEAPGLTVDGLRAADPDGLPVVCMKVDVEGAEDRTIRGARHVLATDRPDVLVEINDRSRVGAIRRLFPRGYGCYSIDETRPVVRRVGLFAQPFDSRNYLFSVRDPREVAALAAWAP